MKSLQDLNNHSQTSLEVDDDRGSKVIFDRVFPLQPLDIIRTISSSTLSVPPGGNEIVDIINYATAATRFRVRIITGGSPLLTGSTIGFGTLPAGLTLTVASGVYTISGISTIAHWNAVKYFVWNLPANFASCPLWYLDVAVVYYDSDLGEDVTVDWEVYDIRYYYIAKLSSQFTQTTIGGNKKQFVSALTSSTLLDCPGSRFQRGSANITASSSMLVNALDLDLANANIVATSTLTVNTNYSARFRATILATTSLAQYDEDLNAITNITNTRTYISNTDNLIFASTTPFIQDADNGTYTITLTSSQGEFGSTFDNYGGLNAGGFSNSNYQYIGTRDQVNAWFPTVKFYPTKNYTGTATFSYTQSKVSGPTLTRNASITNSGTATLESPFLLTFNYIGGSDQIWNVLRKYQLYYQMDYLVVGGGGGGGGNGSFGYPNSNAGMGGGAGRVVYAINQPIAAPSYCLRVGGGGAIHGAPNSATGVNGGTTELINNAGFTTIVSATGGGGGGYANSSVYNYMAGKGQSTFAAGSPAFIAPTGGDTGRIGGPGGGGSGGPGSNGQSIYTPPPLGPSYTEAAGSGGNGTSNSITGSSVVYAKGGNGSSTVGSSTIDGTYNKAQQTGIGSGGTAGKQSYTGGATIAAQPGLPGVVIIRVHP